MMRITNLSKVAIECKIDDMYVCIKPGVDFDWLEDFDVITFVSSVKSHTSIEAEKSKILKVLSFFDDPFNLNKEYHLAIESSFNKERIGNSRQLNITLNTCYADVGTQTYYNYVKLEADGVPVKPNEAIVSEKEKIQNDFIINNIKLSKWQSIWDVIIEPVIFEIIGYYAVYRIFSIWLGMNAWKIVLFLLVPNVLFEVLGLLFKRRKYQKRADKFLGFLNSKMICDCCYN